MAKRKHGQVSLTEIGKQREEEEAWKEFRSDYTFYRLRQGVNNLRIISNPSNYYIHWLDDEDTGKMFRVICDNDESCDFCKQSKQNPHERKLRKSPRYGFWIIDRDDQNSTKMFEVGRMIFDGICRLIRKNKGMDIKTYDISITRDGEGIQTRYNVGGEPSKVKVIDPQIVEDAKDNVSDIPIELIVANKGKNEFVQDLLETKRVMNRNW